MEKNPLLYQIPLTQFEEKELTKRIQDRALGKEKFDFSPYSCFIEYKPADPITGIQYRDCVIDYTRCSNQKCIKKLT
ncbi:MULTISPECIES: hypothetical protein [Leptospira]|uniref:Uncharacterized protein n=25 Tax=Leptospira TaxID=171 RepID=Q8F627_LEPIN|nr:MULTISPECIES: hypothetical protein [Leptospira]APH42090.1 Uncharacterized protein A9P81_2434 [Leptospira interrogans serovar Copenhageni/Icterohaemorrhagiae]EMF44705.1 hypothetical protein LEP1GSC067_2873 [Leptospira interrogans serovar Lora str. TE 1992]EMF70753.1 hypothetical protein LEP1GSC148_4579 [Leptospira interrogans serovar Canicola str. LT1962]EMG13177.1 hypothetical protein LEP1GSC151_1562 [Leptospira interrogans serovar Grippotyphosa str. LT2186]EMG23859.1 hypothetical protein L